jgi:hypothetical protein
MDEDDLVSYRQYTINNTGMNRAGKKRPAPAPSPTRTTSNAFDQEMDILDDLTAISPKQRVSGSSARIFLYITAQFDR